MSHKYNGRMLALHGVTGTEPNRVGEDCHEEQWHEARELEDDAYDCDWCGAKVLHGWANGTVPGWEGPDTVVCDAHVVLCDPCDSGYKSCSCRDCMSEPILGWPGSMCDDCLEAGCEPLAEQECQAPGAYSATAEEVDD